MELVEGMLETDFMGWGKTYSGSNPRVLFLYPFPKASYEDVKCTLDELQSGGAITYVEDWH